MAHKKNELITYAPSQPLLSARWWRRDHIQAA